MKWKLDDTRTAHLFLHAGYDAEMREDAQSNSEDE